MVAGFKRPVTHLVTSYMDLYSDLAGRCRLRFHVSVETDRERLPGLPPPASPVAKRLQACAALRQAGHCTVVTAAPLLPIDDPQQFFTEVGRVADAVVLDHFVIGDGTPDGRLTRRTELPAAMASVNPLSVELSYREQMALVARRCMPGRVGVSMDGFAGLYT